MLYSVPECIRVFPRVSIVFNVSSLRCNLFPNLLLLFLSTFSFCGSGKYSSVYSSHDSSLPRSTSQGVLDNDP